MLLRATLVNLQLLFGLLILGFGFGTLVAVIQVYGNRLVKTGAFTFEWIFRSIPAVILIVLFFYGPLRFGINITPFQAALVALGLRSAAYQSQIFRGAIQAIPPGQMMAARSVGMSRPRAILSIILPQAFRLAIPGWSNEFSSVAKDTTLAYIAGMNEVLRAARVVSDTHYDLTLPVLLLVAVIFLILTYAGNGTLALVERKVSIPGLQMPGARKGEIL